MPRLPFEQVDLLIIDEIGKNISGTGMDTNVVGRKFNDHAAAERRVAQGQADRRPRPDRGDARQRHRHRHGRVLHARTIDGIDMEITRINCLTGGHPTGAMLPVDYATDREVLDAALPTIGLVEPENAKVVQISNTLHVGEVLVSEAYPRRRSAVATTGDPRGPARHGVRRRRQPFRSPPPALQSLHINTAKAEPAAPVGIFREVTDRLLAICFISSATIELPDDLAIRTAHKRGA